MGGMDLLQTEMSWLLMPTVASLCAELDVANQCALQVPHESAQLDAAEVCREASLLVAAMGIEMAARYARVLWLQWRDRNCQWRGLIMN